MSDLFFVQRSKGSAFSLILSIDRTTRDTILFKIRDDRNPREHIGRNKTIICYIAGIKKDGTVFAGCGTRTLLWLVSTFFPRFFDQYYTLTLSSLGIAGKYVEVKRLGQQGNLVNAQHAVRLI